MAECHFWADVMLRQSRVWNSKASPAQKSQGLRVVSSKTFSRCELVQEERRFFVVLVNSGKMTKMSQETKPDYF